MQIIKYLLGGMVFFIFFLFPDVGIANRVTKNPPSPSQNIGSGAAGGEWSGDITAVTNYVSYGNSSSNNLPALQGTLSYSFNTGLYVSVWGSNAIIDGWKQSLELYPSLGWSGDGEKWSWYIQGAHDTYFFRPANMNPGYWEFEGALTRKVVSSKITLGLTYAPQYYAIAGETFYPFFRLAIPLKQSYSLHAQYAYADIQKNDLYGLPNYSAFRLGIKKKQFLGMFDAGIYVFATTVKYAQCFPDGPGMPPQINVCGPGVFATLAKQFG